MSIFDVAYSSFQLEQRFSSMWPRNEITVGVMLEAAASIEDLFKPCGSKWLHAMTNSLGMLL